MGDDLGWNNIQKHGQQIVIQNYLHDEDKEVRKETIFQIFRWNIFLHDSYQADEFVTEIEKWKQNVLVVCVKSFSIKCIRNISCILQKLYYMNLKFYYS